MRKNERTAEELLRPYDSYAQGVEAIREKVAAGKLIPVRASGTNGKNPPLYKRYRLPVTKPKSDFDAAGLAASLPLCFNPDWYLSHPAQFARDAPAIEKLVTYLAGDPDLSMPVSVNERSFEIFGQEKFLNQSGFRILKNLGAGPDFLNTYETFEPLSCFRVRPEPSFLLILENLDPFWTCRFLLSDKQCPGSVAYGAGWKIVNTMQDLLSGQADWMKDTLSRLSYLGDLDWEGIQIWEALCAHYPQLEIPLCVPGYLAMLEKGQCMGIERLPRMKEGQQPCPDSPFFEAFAPEEAARMRALLE